MPLTIDEIIADGSQVAALVNKVKKAVEALPPPPAPISAAAYGKIVGDVAPELGLLIDQIREDVAD